MATSKNLLTKQQIADQSGVKIGRVKYYMSNFPTFFEEHKVSGKAHPMYEGDSVAKVQLISDLISDRKSHDEIETALIQAGYSSMITMVDARAKTDDKSSTIDEQSPSSIVPHQAIVNSLESMNQVVNQMGKVIEYQQDQLKQKDNTIKELKEELDEKNQIIEDLQSQQPKKRGK